MSTEAANTPLGKRPYLQWKIGDELPEGDEIAHIYGAGAEYIVYLTKRGHVGKSVSGGTDARVKQLIPDLARYDELGTQLKSREDAVGHDYMLVIAHCASSTVESTRDTLEGLMQRMIDRLQMRGRLRYLLTCMLCVAVVGLGASALAIWQPIRGDLRVVFYVAACGGFGGLLSVVRKLKELEIDPYTDSYLSIASACSRILIGMIGGFVAYCLIRADIAFGLFTRTGSPYAIFVVCVAAGFSENLVPNIMRRIESEDPGT